MANARMPSGHHGLSFGDRPCSPCLRLFILPELVMADILGDSRRFLHWRMPSEFRRAWEPGLLRQRNYARRFQLEHQSRVPPAWIPFLLRLCHYTGGFLSERCLGRIDSRNVAFSPSSVKFNRAQHLSNASSDLEMNIASEPIMAMVSKHGGLELSPTRKKTTPSISSVEYLPKGIFIKW